MRYRHLYYSKGLDGNQWDDCQLRIFEDSHGRLRLRTILSGKLWDTYSKFSVESRFLHLNTKSLKHIDV